jgi:cation diffusion facilitator CzcD-associated flavoprotein CzcO
MPNHTVIVIGAGPGGLAVAADLLAAKIDVIVLEKGDIGQSWYIYPTDTHLLSESTERPGHHDENMIAGVPTSEVFPNMPHPSHLMYQKYLEHVAEKKQLPIEKNVEVVSVMFNPDLKEFVVTLRDDRRITSRFVVWAAGMYSTPNEDLDCAGAYIHYAHMPYLEKLEGDEFTVVGSANGASSVVLELAKPGRKVNLVVSHTYEVPQPIDCLWKEQMQFIQELEKQGLVTITENFRVKRIYDLPDEKKFVLESETGQKMKVNSRPIVCTGFSPNIGPINELVEVSHADHDPLLVLDKAHQSKKQPGLYVGGAIGKFQHEEGFIRFFRDFGKVITLDIQQKLAATK